MAIVAVGLNHTTAPVAVRERLAFSDATLAQALAHFCPPEVHELVILSTCNRVEMYMQTRDVEASVASCVAKSSLPRTPIVIGAVSLVNAFEGHSTKRTKL